MQVLSLGLRSGRALNVLCLGAHSDDIEIGCGGTILHLTEQFPSCVLHWVVFSALGVRAAEAKRGAELFAGTTTIKGPVLKPFQDGFMPFVGAEIKATFEELKAISPDLIFTHNRKDAHQDHRLIAELTWNTFRDHLILEYEIPKYDGDLASQCLVRSSLEPSRRSFTTSGGVPSLSSPRDGFRQETFLA